MGESKQIQNYLLEHTLGTGTFGKVKLATHKITGQKVAVKILEKCRISTKADLTRVQRELYILRKIRHPHIVQLYEILESDTNIYLVMEYAKGGELFEFIVKQVQLPEEVAATCLLQLIEAVEYLHTQGVVHRDLKPENLLLNEHQHLKVVDFGLSNTYKPDEKLKTACGSPCYAAPEMLHGKPYDGKMTDIWSCGVVLYAMLCGFLPFEDVNTSDLYEKIKYDDFELPPSLSPAATSLLTGMLNKDPLRRFTFERIKSHPFLKRIKFHKLSLKRDLDYRILEDMSTLLNIPQTQIIDYLNKNKHNSITATYYLYQLQRINEAQTQNVSLQRKGREFIAKRTQIKMKTDVNTTSEDLSFDHKTKYKINSTGGSSSKEITKQLKSDMAVKSLQSTLGRRKNNFFEKSNDYQELLKITNSINIRGISNTLKQMTSPDQVVQRQQHEWKPIPFKKVPSKSLLQLQQMIRANSLKARSSQHSVHNRNTLQLQLQKSDSQQKNASRDKISSVYGKQVKTMKSENNEPESTLNKSLEPQKKVVVRHYLPKQFYGRQRSVGREQQALHDKKYLDDSSFTQQIEVFANQNPYMKSVGPMSPSTHKKQVLRHPQADMIFEKHPHMGKRKVQRITDTSKNQQRFQVEQIYTTQHF